MGLAGGPNGPKALFKEKFHQAFKKFQSLKDTREAVGVTRHETLVVVDGNVLVMQVPASVDTFPAYVAVLANQLNGAIQAGEHVVVVFDEPASLTKAKQEEQKARDARRAPQTPVCSDDVVAVPMNDDYTREILESAEMNLKLLMNHRQARSRFYDGLCVAVIRYLQANMAGDAEWSLTFDGVDPRGADRPIGEKRSPGILSTHPELWEAVLHRQVRIGEGDLKLTDVCERVCTAPVKAKMPEREGDVVIVYRIHGCDTTPIDEIKLLLMWTIDTDSFAIELIQQARRACKPEGERNELALLCLREPTRKRKGELPEPAHFNCLDLKVFYKRVETYMFGTVPPNPERMKLTSALLAASLAMCGCDFLEIRGMRADLVLPIVRDIARNKPEKLALMAGVFTGHAGSVRTAIPALEAVIQEYSENLAGMPRMQKSHMNASNYNELQLLRACWISSYWSGFEFKDVTQWGWPASQIMDD